MTREGGVLGFYIPSIHCMVYIYWGFDYCLSVVVCGLHRYRSTFFLVFDFCDHDLAGLLSNYKVTFSLGEIKSVMHQLLNGLFYIHSNKIIHR